MPFGITMWIWKACFPGFAGIEKEGNPMSVEKVKAYFRQFGMEDRIRELPQSSATVEMAAQALNCAPCRIAKTLSFDRNGQAILVVTAGDQKIDNAKYKHRFGVKAKMLSRQEAAERIGHGVGGVCPFGVNEGVQVYLDCSLQRFETIFPGAGGSNAVMEITIPELETHSRAEAWVDVCKPVL